MSDLISRQAAIEVLGVFTQADVLGHTPKQIVEALPSAQPEMIKEIRKWINSGNRGNADYFIVDKIEEIINKYE